jgi:hypothetical protein
VPLAPYDVGFRAGLVTLPAGWDSFYILYHVFLRAGITHHSSAGEYSWDMYSVHDVTHTFDKDTNTIKRVHETSLDYL